MLQLVLLSLLLLATVQIPNFLGFGINLHPKLKLRHSIWEGWPPHTLAFIVLYPYGSHHNDSSTTAAATVVLASAGPTGAATSDDSSGGGSGSGDGGSSSSSAAAALNAAGSDSNSSLMQLLDLDWVGKIGTTVDSMPGGASGRLSQQSLMLLSKSYILYKLKNRYNKFQSKTTQSEVTIISIDVKQSAISILKTKVQQKQI